MVGYSCTCTTRWAAGVENIMTIYMFERFIEVVVDFVNALTVPHSLEEKDW